MNAFKFTYWIATVVMAILIISSIFLNIFKYEGVSIFYESLGFPIWLIYISCMLKVVGLIAIFSRKSDMIKEWSYAGFFFIAIMAFSAHQIAQDGNGEFALIAAIAVMVSRIFEEKVYPEKSDHVTTAMA
ncbi:MAG: DoxX family protein [Saprospiraceae bacterium]|nr:DoxX family protein [Saprospiraceae bacterium]